LPVPGRNTADCSAKQIASIKSLVMLATVIDRYGHGIRRSESICIAHGLVKIERPKVNL
jgi:hypothetical protein